MFDSRTLIIAVSISLVSTLITVFISGIINRNIAGVRDWMSGYVLLALGLLLQGGQGLINPLFSVFLANIIIPSGFAMIWLGILRYKGRVIPHYWHIVGGIVLFMLIMHSVTGLGPEGFAMRTIFMSGVCGLINLLSAIGLLKTGKAPTAAERFTGIILLVMSIALFIRALTVSSLPESLILTDSNPHNYFTYTMAMVFNILFSFGLIIMPSERLQSRLSHLADTDFLTGILSRRAFATYANRLIGRNKHKQQNLSLLLFDIDDFKQVNDQYGHSAGDQVLQTICQKIKDVIRPTDLFGRIGGEEFAILFTDASLDTSKMIAERIRRLIQETHTAYENISINTTISLGLIAIPPETSSFECIYKQADQYLYAAKNEGKNRVAYALAS